MGALASMSHAILLSCYYKATINTSCIGCTQLERHNFRWLRYRVRHMFWTAHKLEYKRLYKSEDFTRKRKVIFLYWGTGYIVDQLKSKIQIKKIICHIKIFLFKFNKLYF